MYVLRVSVHQFVVIYRRLLFFEAGSPQHNLVDQNGPGIPVSSEEGGKVTVRRASKHPQYVPMLGIEKEGERVRKGGR